MIKTCAECGKEFDVLWPELWRYKRGYGTQLNTYLCSWGCLRKYDEKRGDKEAMGDCTRVKKDGSPAMKPGPKKRKEVIEKDIDKVYAAEQKAVVEMAETLPEEARIRAEEPERIIEETPLEPASLKSRVLKANWKLEDRHVFLSGPDLCMNSIALTEKEWIALTYEIRQALKQLGMSAE